MQNPFATNVALQIVVQNGGTNVVGREALKDIGCNMSSIGNFGASQLKRPAQSTISNSNGEKRQKRLSSSGELPLSQLEELFKSNTIEAARENELATLNLEDFNKVLITRESLERVLQLQGSGGLDIDLRGGLVRVKLVQFNTNASLYVAAIIRKTDDFLDKGSIELWLAGEYGSFRMHQISNSIFREKELNKFIENFHNSKFVSKTSLMNIAQEVNNVINDNSRNSKLLVDNDEETMAAFGVGIENASTPQPGDTTVFDFNNSVKSLPTHLPSNRTNFGRPNIQLKIPSRGLSASKGIAQISPLTPPPSPIEPIHQRQQEFGEQFEFRAQPPNATVTGATLPSHATTPNPEAQLPLLMPIPPPLPLPIPKTSGTASTPVIVPAQLPPGPALPFNLAQLVVNGPNSQGIV